MLDHTLKRLEILRRRGRAFSLIELVIVVVVIGIIAAIAIPRMSAGSVGAAESAYSGNLALLRQAIELYHVDHNAFPTCDSLPGGRTTIMAQLTQFTDAAGNVSATRSASHVYGPYLRAIPPVTVGRRKGATRIAPIEGPGAGWIYDPATGAIVGNTESTKDSSGTKLYSDY
jgi:prepilin-type N-terminal cleavage/methylation domain-containing protein